jgi:hypothetical protein
MRLQQVGWDVQQVGGVLAVLLKWAIAGSAMQVLLHSTCCIQLLRLLLCISLGLSGMLLHLLI